MKKILLIGFLMFSCGSAWSQDINKNNTADTAAFEVFMNKKAPSHSLFNTRDFQACENRCSVRYFNCLNSGTNASVCLNAYIDCVNNVCQ